MSFFKKLGAKLDGLTDKAIAQGETIRQKVTDGVASAKDLLPEMKADPTVVTAAYNGRELAISNPSKVSIEFDGGAMAIHDDYENAVIVDSNGGIQTHGTITQNGDVYDLGNDGSSNLVIIQK